MPVIINGTTGISGVDGTAASPAIEGNDANTGMFFPAADTIAFAEGGVEVMRINSSGNVGIGTTSPDFKLSVSGDISIPLQNKFYLYYVSSTNNASVGTNLSGDVQFTTGITAPTERLRIANDGQLSAVVPGGSTLFPAFTTRAWVNFNGTTTTPTIRGSGNVTSITDDGIGLYRVNFTTAMPDVNYATVLTTDSLTDSTGRNIIAQLRPAIYSTTQVGILLFENGASNIDRANVMAVILR